MMKVAFETKKRATTTITKEKERHRESLEYLKNLEIEREIAHVSELEEFFDLIFKAEDIDKVDFDSLDDGALMLISKDSYEKCRKLFVHLKEESKRLKKMTPEEIQKRRGDMEWIKILMMRALNYRMTYEKNRSSDQLDFEGNGHGNNGDLCKLLYDKDNVLYRMGVKETDNDLIYYKLFNALLEDGEGINFDVVATNECEYGDDFPRNKHDYPLLSRQKNIRIYKRGNRVFIEFNGKQYELPFKRFDDEFTCVSSRGCNETMAREIFEGMEEDTTHRLGIIYRVSTDDTSISVIPPYIVYDG
jgi:hypothetical protein